MSVSKFYQDIIAPQVEINEEALSDLLDIDDSDDYTKGIVDLLESADEVEEVTITDDGDVIPHNEFYKNLVDTFNNNYLDDLYIELSDSIEKDINARKEKDRRYAQCLKRLGFSHFDRIGGASFQGASDVTHNAMAVAAIDFSSRAIKEICPVNGGVKSKIVGNATNDKIKLSEKKASFLNYLLTEKINYRDIMEINFSQLCISGSTYLKWGYNDRLKQPTAEFVPIDFLYLPIYTQNFYDADRITHKLKYSKTKFKKLIRDGMYSVSHLSQTGLMVEGASYIDSMGSSGDDQMSEAEQVSMRIDGIDEVSDSQEDQEMGLKTLYEVHIEMEFEDDEISEGVLAPYIITIDANEKVVLSIYRNWAISDKNYEAKQWFVEWKFMPWRGAYGIGFAELFDSTSAALTGALRALLDSAHTQNFPTGFMLKGTGIAGQNRNVSPGEMTEVEGMTGVGDDIRKYIMTLPLGAPSPILLQLMQNLENQFSTLFSATENMSESMASGREVPVGTTMALLEESSKRMSAIHARLHQSNAVSLKILCRILKDNIQSIIHIEALGDAFYITPEDFEHSNDIIPVSNPNIWSNSQRFTQLQSVMQLAQQFPNEYNSKEINRRMLQLIEVPNPEGLLNISQDAGELNAVAENIASMNGLPIQVFSKQDHLAHIICHLESLESAVYGNPVYLSQYGVKMLQHMQKHGMDLYAQVANEILVSTGELGFDSKDSDAMIDKRLVELNPIILKSVEKLLAPYEQRLQTVQNTIQKAQQPVPQDPKMQIEQMKIQAQQQQQQAELQFKQQELQEKLKMEQMTLQNQAHNSQTELEMSKNKANTDVIISSQKALIDDANLKLDLIKTGAAIYEKDMEIQRDLLLNQHAQNMVESKHQFDVMSKGAELHMQHLDRQNRNIQAQSSGLGDNVSIPSSANNNE